MEKPATPLPCPFCGGCPHLEGEQFKWVECATGGCRAEVDAYRTEAEALRAENARLREHIAKQANTINVAGSPHHKAQEALDELVLAVKREARAALEQGDVK